MRTKNYFWLRKWRRIQDKFYDLFPAVERRHYLQYAHKEYGYPMSELEQLWDKCHAEFVPGRMDFLHEEKTPSFDFFTELAGRNMDESVNYTCIRGNCTIMWNERTDRFVGAFGRAGCDCDDVRDMSTRRER